MTNDEALSFLSAHQPFDDDDSDTGPSLTEEDCSKLDQVLQLFCRSYDERCIPLILNCFGVGDGLCVYQTAHHTLREYPASAVVPHLCQSLRNPLGGVRRWAAELAIGFPDERLTQPLLDYLGGGDETYLFFALSVLQKIGTPAVKEELLRHLAWEDNDQVVTAIRETLEAIS